jgi:aminoglycoside phosphotransferase (APT) family kinase protein
MSAASVNTSRLAAYLRSRGAEVTGELRGQLITGGRSNLTYELTDEAGVRHVLRMPPRSADAAQSHDTAREHGILAALAGSPVPVPAAGVLCDDAGVLGAPFYVADFVDGAVLAMRADGAALAPTARAVASRSIVDALSAIHSLDVVRLGLDGLGRGTGYIERQLRRWADRAARPDALSSALLLEVHEALAADVPATQRTCLVHGDYKFPNVIVDGETGAVRAVLDWELATIGDPLADLGNLLAMWPNPGEAALVDMPTSNAGFLTRAAVVEQYAAQTGLDVSAVDWYHAFALWKVACLLAGVVERYRGGAMAADDFDPDAGAALVGELGRAARALLSAVVPRA